MIQLTGIANPTPNPHRSCEKTGRNELPGSSRAEPQDRCSRSAVKRALSSLMRSSEASDTGTALPQIPLVLSLADSRSNPDLVPQASRSFVGNGFNGSRH